MPTPLRLLQRNRYFGLGLLLLALSTAVVFWALDADSSILLNSTRNELHSAPALEKLRDSISEAISNISAKQSSPAQRARLQQFAMQATLQAKQLGVDSQLILDPQTNIYHLAYLCTVKLPEHAQLLGELGLRSSLKETGPRISFLRQSLITQCDEEFRALELSLHDKTDSSAQILRQECLERRDLGQSLEALHGDAAQEALFWEHCQQAMQAALNERLARLELRRHLRMILLLANLGLAWLLLFSYSRRSRAQAQEIGGEALAERERNFRALFDQIPVGVLVHDRGIFVEANQAAAELLQTPGPHLIGRSLSDFIAPDQRAIFLDKLKKRDLKLDHREEQEILLPSGERRMLDVSASDIEMQGKHYRLTMLRDVTQARMMQAQLSANEERFRALVENLYEALVLMSPEGRVLYASASTERITGYKPDERVGSHSSMVLHPDDQDRIWAIFGQAVADPSRAYAFEGRLRHKDGHYIQTQGILQNFLANSAIHALVLNYRDVSAEKKIQQALLESEGRFRALVEHSTEATVLVDAQGIIRYSTPSVLRILGYNPEEDIGRDTLSLVHPEDHFYIKEMRRKIQEQPGVPFLAEYRMLHKDGSWRLVEATVVDYTHDPAIGHRVNTYRDITQRRAAEHAMRSSEEFHRALIENARDAILIYHKDGRFSFENSVVTEMTGYSQEQLSGMNVFERVHPQDLPRVLKELESTLKDPQHTSRLEFRFQALDGTWKDFEARGHNLIGNAAVQGVLVHIRDTTQRKAAQRQLLRYERLAAIGQTASGLAHEIRNPLAIISTAVHLIKSQVPGMSGVIHDLEGIDKQVKRLKDLVTETLERSTIEEPELAPAPASQLFDRALEAAQIRYGQSSGRFEIYKDYAQPDPQILADLGQMERVLVNLILNAFQAMPSGGALTLRTRDQNNSVLLELGDNGPGIPLPELPKIFEPFFSTKDQGSGLGLWICKNIVEDHGGSLEVANIKPRGCLFSIRLPFSPKGPA